MLVFNTTWFQEFTARKISGFLSHRLGTSVTIGLTQIDLPNHLTLYDVSMLDQKGCQMLKSGRLSVRMSLSSLLEGKVTVQTAQLFGTHVSLSRATKASPLNIQFVLDSLASKDTTSSELPQIRVNSMIVRRSSVSYNCLDAPQTPGLFNASHILLSNISSHIILKHLSSDSIDINVKRLSFTEQSGLNVKKLGFKFSGGTCQSLLQDASVELPATQIRFGDIAATYRFDADTLSLPSLRFGGSLAPSVLSLADLAFLLPRLKDSSTQLHLESSVSGTGDNISRAYLLASTDNRDFSLSADGSVSHIATTPQFEASINELSASTAAASSLTTSLQALGIELPGVVQRIENFTGKGSLSGSAAGDMAASASIDSKAGNIVLSAASDPRRNIKGNITATDINLQQLTANKDLGLLTADIAFDGSIPAGMPPAVNATGTVGLLEIKGYSYENIDLNATYAGNSISGTLKADDNNLGLNIDGEYLRQGSSQTLQLTANVMTLKPKALNLTSQWGDANFIGDLQINVSGSRLDNIIGSVRLSDFSMLSADGSYDLAQLVIESGYNDEGIHFMDVTSDFCDATITGSFDYPTLTRSFTNIIADRLPTLPGMPKGTVATDNDFAISLSLSKSDWLQRLFGVPLRLDRPLTLHAAINDALGQLAMECDIPRFAIGDNSYSNASLSISSPSDSLKYDVRLCKESDSGDSPLQIHAEGSAYDNLLTVFLDWDNHARESYSGQFNAAATFDTTLDGQQTAYISVNPSVINMRGKLWDVDPAYIIYSKSRLDVPQFAIQHDQQFITVSGTASDMASDSLNIELQGIDIAYILDLVDFDAVSFDGLASGSATIKGAFGNLQANASLTVSDFLFQQGRMGTLQAEALWNNDREQIDIHAVSNDGPEARTLIDGYVTPQRDSINLQIVAEGTYLDFAQSFTSSFISHIDGHANGAVRLIGPLSAINIEGELVLNGSAHVKTLGCTYNMVSDTLRCIPDEMIFADCNIYDKHGHRGVLTGGIHHKHLTKLTYDIYVDADNLLAYDFKDFGDDTFYGTVFATGRAGIHGLANETRIEGDFTPQPGSTFVYNAANPDAVANQEFIEWGKANTPDTLQLRADSRQATADDPSPDYRSDMHLALRINATPDATIRLLMDSKTNDYITLHGSGVLSTSYYNKGGFQMFGTYRVSNGTYDITIQDIIRKNFVFNDGGTVVFSGDPYDAALNLQAKYTVSGVSLSDLNVGRSFSNTVRVDCLMDIGGQAKSPAVSFDLDMPTVSTDEKQMVRSVLNSQEELNQQVVYLLAVGRFYPQQTNNSASDENDRSQTSLAMQSLLSGTLSGQINSVLSSVVNSSDWNFGANISTGDEGWNNAEYEGLVSGRLLNNRLLINGQFGYRDNATTTTPSFIGDFDIRYLLLPNGNLALKVYNQNNDRYFTRSTLNTQGIGVIMKKDFSGLRDLFGIGKNRKKAEKK